MKSLKSEKLTSKRQKPQSATPLSDELRASGNWNPKWDPIAEVDAIWTEKFMVMGMHPNIKKLIDPKTLEFLAIAVDASCTHMYAPGVRRHIRKALELGATADEIAAVLQYTSVLGIHTMSLGAPILLEELDALAMERASLSKSAGHQAKSKAISKTKS
jgi:alkylhydroperoxidase/carboxymuconolactone decarboxylase family protein YurZ